MKPYYEDADVTLWHGDCRDLQAWRSADVLVTDPPYGIAWETGNLGARRRNGTGASRGRKGIANDIDTSVRDAVLGLWGDRPSMVFGSLSLAPPAGTRQVLVYRKPSDAGIRGTTAGFVRDLEAVYLIGPWPSGIGGRTSLLTTGARVVGNPTGMAARYGHPHAKPVDVLELLLAACPSGIVADPCAGAGSTLIAARNQGRRAVGVELEERYCEAIVRRLAQDVLPVEMHSREPL